MVLWRQPLVYYMIKDNNLIETICFMAFQSAFNSHLYTNKSIIIAYENLSQNRHFSLMSHLCTW